MQKEPNSEHQEMMEIMRENLALTKENNEYLRKLYRHSLIGVIVKVLWIAIIIGIPFAVYFYFLEPYFEAFGANYETFRVGMQEIPGLKGLENLLPSWK